MQKPLACQRFGGRFLEIVTAQPRQGETTDDADSAENHPQIPQIRTDCNPRKHKSVAENTEVDFASLFPLRFWRYDVVAFGFPVCLGVLIAGGLNSYWKLGSSRFSGKPLLPFV